MERFLFMLLFYLYVVLFLRGNEVDTCAVHCFFFST